MISFDAAFDKVLHHSRLLSQTEVDVASSLGYVLAADLFAPTPIPRFSSSSVDGYAIRSSDFRTARRRHAVTLPIQATIAAGDTKRIRLHAGSVIRILTGAPVPLGADAVCKQEDVLLRDGFISSFVPLQPGAYIRVTGGEFARGEKMLERGTVISPPVMALLATLGVRHVRVRRKPRVTVIVTGDELRPAGTRLQRGEIFDANTSALNSMLLALGIERPLSLQANDTKASIRRAFAHAMREADIIISSGGVSVGSSDLVKDVYYDLQVRPVFWGVAMKPGKPIFFGTRGKQLVFGLPGNPVSAMIGFHLFVAPAVRRMMGVEKVHGENIAARLLKGVKKTTRRTEFVRALLRSDANGRLAVQPVQGQDSHMVGGLANANCLIRFPEDEHCLRAGQPVLVMPLRWGLF